METKIKWNEGDGYITATYEGSGSGSASISSDVNEGIDREQSIKVETTDKSKSASISVKQEGLREVFLTSDGDFVLADGGTFNVLKGLSLVRFTIQCQAFDYGVVIQSTALEGMTWGEWVSSEYNNCDAHIWDNKVYVYEDEYIAEDIDTIIQAKVYETEVGIT